MRRSGMVEFDRREFLRRTAAFAALSAARPALGATFAQAAQNAPVTARVEVYPRRRSGNIPLDFTGLSYETAQLADPRFFSPQNKALIALMRRLGAHGVLRVGGNTSEFAFWSPGGTLPAALAAKPVGVQNGGWSEPPSPATPEAIRNLAGFLEAAGWSLIWGLNLGHGSPADAAEEAACVAKYAGKRLVALQIGNEPDLYKNNGLRPRGWGFDGYLKEWRAFAQAVRRRVRQAKFAAPDVASRTDWITQFAAQAADEIMMLTGHYYAEGPPTDPRMTLERLLRPSPRLERDIPRIMKAAHEAGRPFRMAELNSCYQGGKPGVSNTLGAAVWGADLMLSLARAGYAGVNFHGGSRNVIKAGLGGKLPGASLQTHGPARYPGAFYAPIAGNLEVGFAARPLYYGMMLAGQLAGAAAVETNVEASGLNVTAYAALSGGGLRVAIFNKELATAAQVTLAPGPEGDGRRPQARLWRLSAPAPESTSDVTLAGAEVDHAGGWQPREETLTRTGPGYALLLPPASAALVFLRD